MDRSEFDCRTVPELLDPRADPVLTMLPDRLRPMVDLRIVLGMTFSGRSFGAQNRTAPLGRLVVVHRVAACAVALGLLVTACGSSRTLSGSARPPSRMSSGGRTSSTSRDVSVTIGTHVIVFKGVALTVPSAWPVIDGGHASHSCTSTFAGQADKVFLGISYQGVPACPFSLASPPDDGVWMQPGGSNRPPGTSTTLSGGQRVYLYRDGRSESITVWFHQVSIQIGIGRDPTVERAILNSIAYTPKAPDSSVLGRCPSPQPDPPAMPMPTRVTTSLAVGDANAQIRAEPSNVQPRVSASTAWASLFHDRSSFAGPIRWSIVFGSYSAAAPAHINADGTATPEFQGVPTWLVRGVGYKTPYGSCGPTVIAPFDATSGSGMGLEMIG